MQILAEITDCKKEQDAKIYSLHLCSILHRVGVVYFSLSFIVRVYIKEEDFTSV